MVKSGNEVRINYAYLKNLYGDTSTIPNKIAPNKKTMSLKEVIKVTSEYKINSDLLILDSDSTMYDYLSLFKKINQPKNSFTDLKLDKELASMTKEDYPDIYSLISSFILSDIVDCDLNESQTNTLFFRLLDLFGELGIAIIPANRTSEILEGYHPTDYTKIKYKYVDFSLKPSDVYCILVKELISILLPSHLSSLLNTLVEDMLLIVEHKIPKNKSNRLGYDILAYDFLNYCELEIDLDFLVDTLSYIATEIYISDNGINIEQVNLILISYTTFLYEVSVKRGDCDKNMEYTFIIFKTLVTLFRSLPVQLPISELKKTIDSLNKMIDNLARFQYPQLNIHTQYGFNKNRDHKASRYELLDIDNKLVYRDIPYIEYTLNNSQICLYYVYIKDLDLFEVRRI